MDTASEHPQEPPRGRPLFDIGLQWLPSDVTDEDFTRVWQLIRKTLTPDYLEYLNVAAAKASRLRYEDAPPTKIAGAMFDGFVGALIRVGPDLRRQLIILAIIERHLKRAFLYSTDPLDFDGAGRDEHWADALETSGEWALDVALSQKLAEQGLKLKQARFPSQCAASLPNIRREWEVCVRRGIFLSMQRPTPVAEPRSRTHLSEAAHFSATAVLLEFEQLRRERGVTEYDVLDERHPDLEGAHRKTVGKAVEILFAARRDDATAQFGEGCLSTLADPIAEDVVDDLCRLPLPIKPFLQLERSRRSAPDNEPDLRFDLRFLTRGALAGNQEFRNVVRQWAEPTLSKLVAKCRSMPAPVQAQLVEGDAPGGEAHDSAPSGDDSSSVSAEPEEAERCPDELLNQFHSKGWIPQKALLLDQYIERMAAKGKRVTLQSVADAVEIDISELHKWRKGKSRSDADKLELLERLLSSVFTPSEFKSHQRS